MVKTLMLMAGVLALALAIPVVLVGALAAPSQSPRGVGGERGTSPSRGDSPSGHHGTPKGWKFSWPKGGDSTRGREIFIRLECYSCHEVRGESFPAPTDRARLGPELSAMGPVHNEAYFAESIINPGAVIEKGKGYAGPDGSSKMPSFNDSITVQDVTDLVAYLRRLKPPGRPSSGTGDAAGEHKKH